MWQTKNIKIYLATILTSLRYCSYVQLAHCPSLFTRRAKVWKKYKYTVTLLIQTSA